MSHPIFSGPRAKLQRAKQHISELQRVEREFFQKPGVVIQEKEDIVEDRVAHKVKITQKLGDEAATIASDVIGNLRSALDISVCECARLRGTDDPKNTYFHFASSEDEWDKSYRGRTKFAPQTIVALMRAIKPWSGGNNLLYGLSKLATMDKHKLLVPVGISSPASHYESIKAKECRYLSVPTPVWNIEKCEMVYLIVGKNDEIDWKINISFLLAFGEVEIVKNQPVIPTLINISEIIDCIITTFEGEMRRPI